MLGHLTGMMMFLTQEVARRGWKKFYQEAAGPESAAPFVDRGAFYKDLKGAVISDESLTPATVSIPARSGDRDETAATAATAPKLIESDNPLPAHEVDYGAAAIPADAARWDRQPYPTCTAAGLISCIPTSKSGLSSFSGIRRTGTSSSIRM